MQCCLFPSCPILLHMVAEHDNGGNCKVKESLHKAGQRERERFCMLLPDKERETDFICFCQTTSPITCSRAQRPCITSSIYKVRNGFEASNDAMSDADSAGSRDRASKASRSTGGQVARSRLPALSASLIASLKPEREREILHASARQVVPIT